ncbi:MAG: hypothetical protein NZ557_10985 [Chthonomonadaceae bacterium]|nr:hypothetical protein [Chthonomonadaceae bacterium]
MGNRYRVLRALLYVLPGVQMLSGLPTLALAPREVRFECVSGHFDVRPDDLPIGPTHGGVAIDRNGLIYVSTDTPRGILVFGPDGRYRRCFGPSHIHSLHLQRERDGEYLYAARPTAHEVLKLRTDGTVVWRLGYPDASGLYAKAEEYQPTNIVALPDGTFFVADGYGKNYVHRYDRDLRYQKSFGGPGDMPAPEGKFHRCHGMTVDLRGKQPLLVICNRESGRVEHWDTEGRLVRVLQRGLRMPAAVQVGGNYLAIAELQGRVTVLDRRNQIVAHVGDNPDPAQRANYGLEPAKWVDGTCNSPHAVAFDRKGNLIVAEWSQFGRVQMFRVVR